MHFIHCFIWSICRRENCRHQTNSRAQCYFRNIPVKSFCQTEKIRHRSINPGSQRRLWISQTSGWHIVLGCNRSNWRPILFLSMRRNKKEEHLRRWPDCLHREMPLPDKTGYTGGRRTLQRAFTLKITALAARSGEQRFHSGEKSRHQYVDREALVSNKQIFSIYIEMREHNILNPYRRSYNSSISASQNPSPAPIITCL